MSSLEKLKKIVENHLKKELDIIEAVLKLSDEDAKKFLTWYVNHPYAKRLEEVIKVIERVKRKAKS